MVRTIYSYNTLDHIDVESEESLKTSIMREVSDGQEEECFLADYRKAHQIEGEGVAHFLIHDSWKNEEDIPFPIVSEISGAGWMADLFALCADTLEYGADGRITGYKGHPHQWMLELDDDGNTLCHGICEYDEAGRPAQLSYYVTHGSHYGWFLYHGREKRPYSYIEVCSMPYSGSEEEPELWGVDAALTFWE